MNVQVILRILGLFPSKGKLYSQREIVAQNGLTGNLAGDLTGDIVATAAASVEYGAGFIGTAYTPTVTRRTEGGVIITQTKFDLTGLASSTTANDVIGLSTTPPVAFIGRNVVATNGVIFKVELSCLETPVGGDLEINIVSNASATLKFDSAGGTTYLSNSGTLQIGQTISNLVPQITANHYFYATGGASGTAAAYTAGQFILTTYGHAVLA